jgi:hypothetical protein
MDLHELIHESHATMRALLIDLETGVPEPSAAREVRLNKLDETLAHYCGAFEHLIDPALRARDQDVALAQFNHGHARLRRKVAELRTLGGEEPGTRGSYASLQDTIAALLRSEEAWLHAAIDDYLPRERSHELARRWLRDEGPGAPATIAAVS